MKTSIFIVLVVAVGVAVADVSELSNRYLPPALVNNGILDDVAITEASAAAEAEVTTTSSATTVVEIEQVPLEEVHYNEQQQQQQQPLDDAHPKEQEPEQHEQEHEHEQVPSATEQSTSPAIYEQPPALIYEVPIYEAQTEVPVAPADDSIVPVDQVAPVEQVVPIDQVVVPADHYIPAAEDVIPADHVAPADDVAPSDHVAPADNVAPVDHIAPAEQVAPTDQVISAEEPIIAEEIPAEQTHDAPVAEEVIIVVPDVIAPLDMEAAVSEHNDLGSDVDASPVPVSEEIPLVKEATPELPIVEAEPEPAHTLSSDGYRYKTASRFRYRF